MGKSWQANMESSLGMIALAMWISEFPPLESDYIDL